METTIQISNALLERLKKMKMNNRESYENIIWDLVEDSAELSEETKKDLAEARREISEGKFKTLTQIKKELRL